MSLCAQEVSKGFKISKNKNYKTVKAFRTMIFLGLIFDFSFIYKDTQQSKQQSDCLQIIIYCKKSNHGLLDRNQSATIKAEHIYKTR